MIRQNVACPVHTQMTCFLMIPKYFVSTLLVFALLCCSVAVQATLIDRGNGLIFDTVLNITWLQDAGLSGRRQPDDRWAEDLVFGGFDDWRRASLDVNGQGPNDDIVNCAVVTEADCRDNELGYMYYINFGGTVPEFERADDLINAISVDGVQFYNIGMAYWSGTLYITGSESPDSPPDTEPWIFGFYNGSHIQGLNGFLLPHIWAVRDGDVIAAVPVSSSLALMLAGALPLVLYRRDRFFRKASMVS